MLVCQDTFRIYSNEIYLRTDITFEIEAIKIKDKVKFLRRPFQVGRPDIIYAHK